MTPDMRAPRPFSDHRGGGGWINELASTDHSGTFRAGQGLLTRRVAGYSTQPHLDPPTTGHHRRVATTAVMVVLPAGRPYRRPDLKHWSGFCRGAIRGKGKPAAVIRVTRNISERRPIDRCDDEAIP